MKTCKPILRRIRRCFKIETHLDDIDDEKERLVMDFCVIWMVEILYLSFATSFRTHFIISFFLMAVGRYCIGLEGTGREGERGVSHLFLFTFVIHGFDFKKVINDDPPSVPFPPPFYSIFPPKLFSNRIYFCSVVLAQTLVVMHQILRTIRAERLCIRKKQKKKKISRSC